LQKKLPCGTVHTRQGSGLRSREEVVIGGRFSLVACHRNGGQYIQDNIDLEKGVRGFLIDLYSDDGPLARD
jgi:hypothetical protein